MHFERKNPKKQAAAVVNVRVLTAVLSRLYTCVWLSCWLCISVCLWHRDRSVVFASSLAVRAERAKGGG